MIEQLKTSSDNSFHSIKHKNTETIVAFFKRKSSLFSWIFHPKQCSYIKTL